MRLGVDPVLFKSFSHSKRIGLTQFIWSLRFVVVEFLVAVVALSKNNSSSRSSRSSSREKGKMEKMCKTAVDSIHRMNE